MIVKSSFIQQLHLDSKNQLLNSKSSLMVHQLFQALDCNENKKLDDVQFESFMNVTTDLKSSEIFKIFDLLDLDGSGCVEFDQVR
jgi:Ca2+-binding EF-hand superfamily protein